MEPSRNPAEYAGVCVNWSFIASMAAVVVVGGCSERPTADPSNAEQVATGRRVYEAHCASCHGAKLEGQPNWRERRPDGGLPATPDDATGHTWHHFHALLFHIVNGIESHPPPGYQSDMPKFREGLSDTEIWAVLAYIKSTWPEETRKVQAAMSAQDARPPR